MSGFITDRASIRSSYRGFPVTVEHDRIVVHDVAGGAKAEFAGMATARRFIRRLENTEPGRSTVRANAPAPIKGA